MQFGRRTVASTPTGCATSDPTPMSHSNKVEHSMAENAEGRPLIKENTLQPHTHPTQSGASVSQGLAGVRKVAREHKEMKFTALLHYVTVDLLRHSFGSHRALTAICSSLVVMTG